MTEAIALDTRRFVRRLTGCGFTEKRAETLAEEQVALLNGNLATRADIARIEADIEALRQETRAGMDALRQVTRASVESAKSDLRRWLFGALTAPGGLIVALVKPL